jgi:hypothetical protein
MRRDNFEFCKIGYESDILLFVSIAYREVEVGQHAFSRTSASSTTTFFFLCKYLNSSSNCKIMSTARAHAMETYDSKKLSAHIGHVLV